MSKSVIRDHISLIYVALGIFGLCTLLSAATLGMLLDRYERQQTKIATQASQIQELQAWAAKVSR